MSWNHRVRKQIIDGEVMFSIVEAFYNENGELRNITVDDIAPVGETLDGLEQTLRRMLIALEKPVLEEPIVFVDD